MLLLSDSRNKVVNMQTVQLQRLDTLFGKLSTLQGCL